MSDPSGCYITKLPTEILLEIMEYVRHHPWDRWTEERISTQSRSRLNLSRIAQVSRLFYEPAMTVLWREVHLSPDGPLDRFLLGNLHSTTKEIPKYIRTIHLTVVRYYGQDESYFRIVPRFVGDLFQLMEAAENLRTVILDFHLVDQREYPPEQVAMVNQTNHILMNLLRYISQRVLTDLELIIWFNPRIDNVIDIMQNQVTRLVVRDWSLTGHWVHKLPELEKLQYIEIQDAHNAETYQCCNIWRAISSLEITQVENTNVPYPLTLDLQFHHLVRVSLEVSPPEGNWSRTFTAVFERMPNLKSVELSSRMFYWFDRIANSVQITSIACTGLRDLTIYPYSPRHLLSAVARSCPELQSCDFGGNLDDQDLQMLSQCRQLRRLRIRFPGDTIRGIPFLANISSLTHLTIPAAFGFCLDEHILTSFAKNCPALNTIIVLARRRRYRDPVVPPDIVFPRAGSLHHIFEPDEFRQRWHSIERDAYKVHIYKLRQQS
jgi:hypothetical protein